MAIVLFDTKERKHLYPLTYARAVADIRLGILTRKEWWETITKQKVYVLTEDYLQPLYPAPPVGTHLFVDALLLPNLTMLKRILLLSPGRALLDESSQLIAFNGTHEGYQQCLQEKEPGNATQLKSVRKLHHVWELFQLNDEFLRAHFELLTHKRKSAKIPKSNHIIGDAANLFLEEGVTMECATINATTGPVYIGKNATVMEGGLIRGPFAMLKNSVLKLGTKVYGATTLGPHCAGGGEIKNALLMGYSNKAHDGYLGDSVLGYWCNLGGGTTNSNIKNTAGTVEMWDMSSDKLLPVGLKGGVVIGDYTRTAINSSINTGSVFGIASNIFGNGFLPKKIPNFVWGDKEKHSYEREKAIQDINRWMALKGKKLKDAEINVLNYIFEHF
ncbi:MAG: putative sugar nucleotidyl transferase [Chitinophagaceae bacterium]